MKIAIYGAGAIGGHLGAMLSRSGINVGLIARGEHLEAMRKNGLRQILKDEEFTVYPTVTDNPDELGAQDYVILTLKSYQAPDVVNDMQPLLGAHTTVATAMNGIPWWYFYRYPGKLENYKITTVDPQNKQWDRIGAERAIGCITYVASEVIEPGFIKTSSSSFLYQIGEPDGSVSQRCTILKEVLERAGINCQIRPEIRKDIWTKVMGNVAYNPTSALTLAHTGAMIEDPDMRLVLRQLMLEVISVGKALDADPGDQIDRRMKASLERAAFHKTSMLQDLERGRYMEILPIVGAAAELAKLCNVKTPTIDTILALVKLRAQMTGQLPNSPKTK